MLVAKKISVEQCGITPRDRGYEVKAIAISCICISWSFYVTRMVARIVLKIGVLGLDDLFLSLAIVVTVGAFLSTLKMANAGLGKDIWAVDIDRFDELLLWYFIGEVTYIWTTCSLKFSLLFSFLRIFKSTTLRKWIYATIAFQAAFLFTFTFVIIFQCKPVSHAWRYWSKEHDGKCVNVNAIGWSIAVTTIILDFVVLSLPVQDLWKLTMSTSKKLYLMLMFGLGFLVTIVSILRLRTLVKFSKTYNLTCKSSVPSHHQRNTDNRKTTTFL
jgi:hypothetical protein